MKTFQDFSPYNGLHWEPSLQKKERHYNSFIHQKCIKLIKSDSKETYNITKMSIFFFNKGF